METPCLYCGQPLKPKAEFCPKCGKGVWRVGAPLPEIPRETMAGRRGLGTWSWEDLKRLLIYYGWMMGLSLVFGLGYRLAPHPATELVYDFIWAGMVGAFLALEWKKVRRAFVFHRLKPKTLLQLLGACLAAFVFLKGYFALFDLFHWPTERVTDSFVEAHWPRWSMFAMNCAVPGVTEEIAFRGVLQTRLSQVLSRREGLIIQAALFSILHLSPVIFVSHFVMGLLLGWVRLRTRHVYFGMALHMAWNATVMMEEFT